MHLIRLGGLAVILTLVTGAQTTDKVTISYAEGQVYLDQKRVKTSTVLSGDGVIRTESGRAGIRLRNATISLGENSSIRLLGNRPYNFDRLAMLNGSAVIVTGTIGGRVTCEDAIALSDRGIFRLDLRGDSCRFRVYQGAASVQLASIAVALRPGKTMDLSRQCGDMIPSNDFDITELDDLDRWGRQRGTEQSPQQ